LKFICRLVELEEDLRIPFKFEDDFGFGISMLHNRKINTKIFT
jgi:hypothetical protein